MKKVLFFTKDTIATAAEMAAIANLNAAGAAPFGVVVLNGNATSNGLGPNFGTDPTAKPRLIPDADYTAGTVPAEYEDIPKLADGEIPAVAPAGFGLVKDGEELPIGTEGQHVKFAVDAQGVITLTLIPAA